MKPTSALSALLLAGLMLAAPIVAAAPPEAPAARPIALADLRQIRDLSEPRLSPDGRWLAYVVSAPHPTRDATHSRIWLSRADGRDAHPLNAAPARRPVEAQGTLQWGPRNELFFLSDRADGVRQVFAQRVGEPRPRQLTRLPQGVADFAVAPDGRRLALIVDDPAPVARPGQAEPPLVTERFQFMEGDDGVWLDDRHHHLHLLDLPSGRLTLLTPGAHDEWLPSWSPDGRQVAYVSKRGEDPDRHNDFNLFTINAQPGAEERQLTDFAGADLDPYWGSRPAWSPDGRRIAYLRGGEPKWLAYAPGQLAVIDLATRQVSEPAHVDRFFYKPRWSPRGDALYALREDSEATHLVRVDLASDTLQLLTTGERLDSDFDLGPDGRVVVLGNGSAAPAEIHALDDGGGLRPLTQANARWLAQVQLQPVQTLQFPAADGTPLHALLVKPAGWAPGRPVPTVVRLHGGPVYQFSHEFMFDWQWYAAQGYAVLAVNPRGSSGRGLDFARAIYADWGRLDVADVLAAVDHLVAQGVADPQRLVIGGHSYGSILTNYVIASDRRFKAAVSSSGGNNMLALYGLDMYARDYEAELGTPWANPEAYARLSYPFLHADRIATPTVFFCGGNDFNVPCAGAQQMYQALRSQKVPTRFVRFPGQGHTLSVPSYIEYRLKSGFEWYERFVRTSAPR
jgi:dipeptidyl aminopeptidase/acylaminoacyl peptidase